MGLVWEVKEQREGFSTCAESPIRAYGGGGGASCPVGWWNNELKWGTELSGTEDTGTEGGLWLWAGEGADLGSLASRMGALGDDPAVLVVADVGGNWTQKG